MNFEGGLTPSSDRSSGLEQHVTRQDNHVNQSVQQAYDNNDAVQAALNQMVTFFQKMSSPRMAALIGKKQRELFDENVKRRAKAYGIIFSGQIRALEMQTNSALAVQASNLNNDVMTLVGTNINKFYGAVERLMESFVEKAEEAQVRLDKMKGLPSYNQFAATQAHNENAHLEDIYRQVQIYRREVHNILDKHSL